MNSSRECQGQCLMHAVEEPDPAGPQSRISRHVALEYRLAFENGIHPTWRKYGAIELLQDACNLGMSEGLL